MRDIRSYQLYMCFTPTISSTSKQEELAMFSFMMLSSLKLRGVRNGNWRRLNRLEKALFDYSLEFAKGSRQNSEYGVNGGVG